MSDADRDSRRGAFPSPCLIHAWQPVSFQFERYANSVPTPDRARVYVVCMQCHRFSYIETLWAGYCLVRPSDQHAPNPQAAKSRAP